MDLADDENEESTMEVGWEWFDEMTFHRLQWIYEIGFWDDQNEMKPKEYEYYYFGEMQLWEITKIEWKNIHWNMWTKKNIIIQFQNKKKVENINGN